MIAVVRESGSRRSTACSRLNCDHLFALSSVAADPVRRDPSTSPLLLRFRLIAAVLAAAPMFTAAFARGRAQLFVRDRAIVVGVDLVEVLRDTWSIRVGFIAADRAIAVSKPPIDNGEIRCVLCDLAQSYIYRISG